MDTYRWSIKNSTFEVFHVTMMSELWKLNPALFGPGKSNGGATYPSERNILIAWSLVGEGLVLTVPWYLDILTRTYVTTLVYKSFDMVETGYNEPLQYNQWATWKKKEDDLGLNLLFFSSYSLFALDCWSGEMELNTEFWDKMRGKAKPVQLGILSNVAAAIAPLPPFPTISQ